MLLPQGRRTLNYVTLAAAACIAALWWSPATGGLLGLLGERLRSANDPTSNPYDARPAIWDEAREQLGNRPLLGSGPNGYSALARDEGASFGVIEPDHAHSLYLSVAAEQGVVGVLLLMGLMCCCLYVARKGRHARTSERQTVVAAAGAALTALAAQGSVDYVLGSPVISALCWLLLGMLAAGACAANRAGEGGVA
jgi:O-antigen ligase